MGEILMENKIYTYPKSIYNQFYYHGICVPKSHHVMQNFTIKTIGLMGKIKISLVTCENTIT